MYTFSTTNTNLTKKMPSGSGKRKIKLLSKHWSSFWQVRCTEVEWCHGAINLTNRCQLLYPKWMLQEYKEEEHPIEYLSRLLNAAERNPSTIERGELAIVWSLNKFHGIIAAHKLNVTSDHQPLKWLMSLNLPSGRLARWTLQIQFLNLKIEYIPGKSNVVSVM